MHQFYGPVALVLVGLWLAYLVPYKLRHRQQMLESRADDRYSEALRVVKVARRLPRGSGHLVRAAAGRAHAGTTGLLTPGMGLPAAAAGNRTGGETVDRPHATPERVTAEAARRAAQVRAARVAATARRAAAARRRAALFVFLVVATATAWVVVGMAPMVSPFVGVVPSALLATVLLAGRRAVLAGRRHDAELAAQIAAADDFAANPRSGQVAVVAASGASGAQHRVAARSGAVPAASAAAVPTPTVTGRAVRPSEAETEVFAAIVADQGEKGASVRHASSGLTAAVRRDATPTQGVAAVAKAGIGIPVGAGKATSPERGKATPEEVDEAWKPVPVPPPTYAMKPAAPRRQPVPLGEVEGSTAVRPAEVAHPAPAPAPSVATGPDEAAGELRTPEAPAAEASGSIDLNAVLAKRRAAGE